MKEKLARFMIGRYGNDELNKFLLAAALVVTVLACLFGSAFLYVPVLAILVVYYYRMLSHNSYKRREENGKFIRVRYKLSAEWKVRREQWIQRKDYKFFTCPSCKAKLRVPRGHGKIKIVCRKCGNSFTGKT